MIIKDKILIKTNNDYDNNINNTNDDIYKKLNIYKVIHYSSNSSHFFNEYCQSL